MNILTRGLAWAALAMTLLLGPVWSADAADKKTVLVVSAASVSQWMGDIKYVTEAAGMPELGGMVQVLGLQYTQGIDTKKPIGVVVQTDGITFSGFAFVPVTNLKQILAKVEQQTGREPKDAGDGILEIEGPANSLFIRELGGWAFLSNSTDNLEGLPVDPTKLLGDLPTRYDLAVQVNVNAIPQNYRDMALDQIRAGYQRTLDQQLDGDDEEQAEFARNLGRLQMEQMAQMFNELDTLLYGFNVDATAKAAYLDLAVTAVNGTKLAKQMTYLADSKSSHAGFLLPEAAVTFNFTSQLAPDDVQRALAMLKQGRAAAERKIEDDSNLPNDEARQAAKGLMNDMLDIFAATVEGGKLDGGAALVLEDKSLTLVAGGLVADGAQMEKILRKIAELAQNEPDFPGIRFNAGKHGSVSFHTLSVPVKDGDEKAKEVFGDTVDVVIGTGPKSVYMALGKGGETLLKKVIDRSAADADATVPPVQAVASLSKVMAFVASVQPENAQVQRLALQLAKAQGQDRVSIRVKSIPNGASYRIEIEEGAIKGLVPRLGGGAAPPGDGF